MAGDLCLLTNGLPETMRIHRIVKIHEAARLPVRMSNDACGFDVCSAMTVSIPALSNRIVKLGLRIQLPPGTMGKICGRSFFSFQSWYSLL